MPRPFKGEEKQRIRELLLQGGRDLVNRMGLRKVTVDDAVKAAGISKGSFYAFFSSREDYLLSVLESWEDHYRPQMLNRMEESSLTPAGRWERFFLEMLTLLESHPGLASIRPEDVRLLEARLPAARIEAHKNSDRQIWEKALERFMSLGILSAECAPALPGVMQLFFLLGLHRNDFESGEFEAAAKLAARALAREMSGG